MSIWSMRQPTSKASNNSTVISHRYDSSVTAYNLHNKNHFRYLFRCKFCIWRLIEGVGRDRLKLLYFHFSFVGTFFLIFSPQFLFNLASINGGNLPNGSPWPATASLKECSCSTEATVLTLCFGMSKDFAFAS